MVGKLQLLIIKRKCPQKRINKLIISLYPVQLHGALILFLFLRSRKATVRGTQRENSSKPLQHSIFECILVVKRRYKHIFVPYKFFICSDFLAESLYDPKIIGIKNHLFENFSQKKAPENSR